MPSKRYLLQLLKLVNAQENSPQTLPQNPDSTFTPSSTNKCVEYNQVRSWKEGKKVEREPQKHQTSEEIKVVTTDQVDDKISKEKMHNRRRNWQPQEEKEESGEVE